jgi:hypothetical protein
LCRYACFSGLIVFLLATPPSYAAEQSFAGRWSESGKASSSVGVIQYGQTVAIFGRAGWSMAVIEPGSDGMLASGVGRWTFEANSPAVSVHVRIGGRDDRLYLLITTEDTDAPAELKVVMEPLEPKAAVRKA